MNLLPWEKISGGLILSTLVVIIFVATGCSPGSMHDEWIGPPDSDGPRQEEDGVIVFPEVIEEDSPIAAALYQRVSRRDFSTVPLHLRQVGNLLWAAGGLGIDGITGPTRTLPSAGATYPLDIYLVAGRVEGLEPGIYLYDYLSHSLVSVADGDRREDLAGAALDQNFIADAPVTVALAARFERTTDRYGERGKRYVHMDAGYASQNIYLMAAEMGLITVAIGAFNDGEVAEILSTASEPLLIMPVGLPLE